MLFESTHASSQSNQIRGDRKRIVLKPWGLGQRRGLCSAGRASVLEDGKSLGMDSSESWYCITLNILMLLKPTLKIAKVALILCMYIYYNLKKRKDNINKGGR